MGKDEKNSKASSFVKKVQKRDGSVVDFDLNRVKTAILKAMLQTKEGTEEEAGLVANKVLA
jgi:anaerobic ribonucleoside-triphosphate reductase